MATKHFVIDECSHWQTVETVREGLPQPHIVPSLACKINPWLHYLYNRYRNAQTEKHKLKVTPFVEYKHASLQPCILLNIDPKHTYLIKT